MSSHDPGNLNFTQQVAHQPVPVPDHVHQITNQVAPLNFTQEVAPQPQPQSAPDNVTQVTHLVAPQSVPDHVTQATHQDAHNLKTQDQEETVKPVKVETEEGDDFRLPHERHGDEDTMEETSEVEEDQDFVLDDVKIKKHQCDQCDYATDWPSNLSKHKKSVHDKIRLACEECDFTTTNHGVLKKHMNNVHNKERTKRRKGNAVRQLLKCDHCNVSMPYVIR